MVIALRYRPWPARPSWPAFAFPLFHSRPHQRSSWCQDPSIVSHHSLPLDLCARPRPTAWSRVQMRQQLPIARDSPIPTERTGKGLHRWIPRLTRPRHHITHRHCHRHPLLHLLLGFFTSHIIFISQSQRIPRCPAISKRITLFSVSDIFMRVFLASSAFPSSLFSFLSLLLLHKHRFLTHFWAWKYSWFPLKKKKKKKNPNP